MQEFLKTAVLLNHTFLKTIPTLSRAGNAKAFNPHAEGYFI